MALTVLVAKKDKVTLKDVVASGGEGNIYLDKGFAYKIYNEPSKCISEAKITELGILDHPSIVRPLDAVFDAKGTTLLGYRMREATHIVSLAQYLTKTFKERNKVIPQNTVDLVRRFQEVINFVHTKNSLLVDINEMNFALNDGYFNTPFFLDVDSYKTPSFPATALMEKVRDFHASTFSTLTDWYSFAVLSFNIFIGIHPFRGGHPNYKHLEKVQAMIQRMKDNISVLHQGATYPTGATLPFDVIPPVYMQWYTALFEEGKRLPPPMDLVAAVQQQIVSKAQIPRGHHFIIDKLKEYEAAIIGYLSCHDINTVLTTQNDPSTIAVVTPKNHTSLIAWKDLKTNKLQILDAKTHISVVCDLQVDSMMGYSGRLYIKQNDTVCEAEFIEGKTTHLIPKIVGNVSLRSAQFFNGVVIENLLGRYHAMMFPAAGMNFTVALPELDKMRVLDAKYENKMLVALVHESGSYHKYYFRLAPTHDSYDVWSERDVDYHDLNFVVLDNGIVVEVMSDGKMSVYQNAKGASGKKVVEDPVIMGDMHLHHDGVKVLFSQGNALYSLKMN